MCSEPFVPRNVCLEMASSYVPVHPTPATLGPEVPPGAPRVLDSAARSTLHAAGPARARSPGDRKSSGKPSSCHRVLLLVASPSSAGLSVPGPAFQAQSHLHHRDPLVLSSKRPSTVALWKPGVGSGTLPSGHWLHRSRPFWASSWGLRPALPAECQPPPTGVLRPGCQQT